MGRRLRTLFLCVGVLALLAGGVVLWALQDRGITPRALAPYLAKRSSGHNSVITGTGSWMADTLLALDRGSPGVRQPPGPRPAVLGPVGTVRLVSSVPELRQAVIDAAPGDAITLMPGTYRIQTHSLIANRPGTAQAGIALRAERPGTVELEVDAGVGIAVTGPFWRFENLTVRGVCEQHARCEHAFHVTGRGAHFAALNNTLVDFNAHFKINGSRNGLPDHGRIEGNVLRNDSVRRTTNPVTPIDLVAVSGWTIRGNAISDFVKGQGDRISYGAFAKGGGSSNLFERNVVVCEAKLQGAPGQRVGLSLGGGGTGKSYCRDRKCITEQEQGVLRDNLVASCSDDGIYLNEAAASKVVHNTLLDTGGIQVRFAGSSADIEGNIVDGPVRSRQGAVVRLNDNLTTSIVRMYLGSHLQRGLFADAASLDLRWDGEAPRRASQQPADLCGTPRPATPAYGAFEDFSACLKPSP